MEKFGKCWRDSSCIQFSNTKSKPSISQILENRYPIFTIMKTDTNVFYLKFQGFSIHSVYAGRCGSYTRIYWLIHIKWNESKCQSRLTHRTYRLSPYFPDFFYYIDSCVCVCVLVMWCGWEWLNDAVLYIIIPCTLLYGYWAGARTTTDVLPLYIILCYRTVHSLPILILFQAISLHYSLLFSSYMCDDDKFYNYIQCI